CFYEGPEFSFTTWGFATLIEPGNGAEGIDPGTIELLFEGDGYQSSFVVYLEDDGETPIENSGSLAADANSWTPSTVLGLSQSYLWYVEEVNTAGTVATEKWMFSTDICATMDNFESYTDTSGGVGPEAKNLLDTWEDYSTVDPGDGAATISLSWIPATTLTTPCCR
ncbi:MAG: hypothetical protein ACYSUL_11885, partial [Planctomycetota bacterium]